MRGNVCAPMLVLLCWAAPAVAQQPVQATTPPVTVVHIDAAQNELVLESEVEPDAWLQVCESPCDQPLPASSRYRVRASGKKTSGTFSLAGPAARDTLHVHAADETASTLGIVAVTAGGAIPLAELLYFASPIFVPVELQPMTQDGAHALEGSLVVAGVLLVTGAALLLTNSRTTVSQDPSPAWSLLVPRAVATGNPAAENVQRDLAPSAGTWLRLGGVF